MTSHPGKKVTRRGRRLRRIEIDEGLLRDLSRACRVWGRPRGEMLEEIISNAIASTIIELGAGSGVPSWQWSGHVKVEPNIESDRPGWLLRARRGRAYWVDVAGGPLATWHQAEAMASELRTLDPSAWDRWIDAKLPALAALANVPACSCRVASRASG